MTDEPRPRDPADEDEIGDSLAINDEAGQHPPPPRRTPPPEPPPAEQPDPLAPRDGATTSPPPFALPFPDAAADATAAGTERDVRKGRWRRGAKSAEASNESKTAKPTKTRRKAPWWELPALVGLAILIAILVKTFLVQPFYIPSASMEKTLHGCPGCSGDRILVNKIIYDFRDPHPGDIIVFNAPTGWNDEAPSIPPTNPIVRAVRGFGQLVGVVPPDGLVLVKRVIATGGQTVKGNAAGDVFISEHGPGGPYRKLNETYVYESSHDARAKFGPITVPKGRLWVMGDHRNDSADSRYHCAPGGQDSGTDDATCDVNSATVPISAVIGKAFVIAWPPSRWTTLGTPKTFTDAPAAAAGAGVVPLGVVAPLYVFRRRRRRTR